MVYYLPFHHSIFSANLRKLLCLADASAVESWHTRVTVQCDFLMKLAEKMTAAQNGKAFFTVPYLAKR